MKTLRIDDFDPNAYKEPALKSTLDHMPAIQKPNTGIPAAPPDPVPPVRVGPPASPPHPQKRVMKQRHPFDIYHDQYDALRAFALAERKQGGLGSMSAMVREAIDKLIAERKQK